MAPIYVESRLVKSDEGTGLSKNGLRVRHMRHSPRTWIGIDLCGAKMPAWCLHDTGKEKAQPCRLGFFLDFW